LTREERKKEGKEGEREVVEEKKNRGFLFGLIFEFILTVKSPRKLLKKCFLLFLRWNVNFRFLVKSK